MTTPLEPYINHLRALPELTAHVGSVAKAHSLEINAAGRRFRLPVKSVSSHLSAAIVAQLMSEARKNPGVIVCAPAISDEIAQRLSDANINYVDRRGNLRLRLGKGYLVWIVGRRGNVDTSSGVTDIRFPGYRAMFAYLAKPDLVHAPLRTVAAESGVSVKAVSAMLERMRIDGTIDATRAGARWAHGQRRRLFEQWLAAYPVQIRGRLLVGSFRVPVRTPDEIERHIEKVLNKQDWQLGGTSAAWRMLRHYRGSRVTIQIEGDPANVTKLLRAIPDPNGDLIILRELSPLAKKGDAAGLAHPLLVYSELMSSGDERAVETANLLFDKVWQE